MKVSYIELLGEQHPMCFSLAASEELSAKFGGLEKMENALASKDIAQVAHAVGEVLDCLLKAGRIYVSAAGGELPAELPCRPADLIDVTDGSAVKAIFTAIATDTARMVETKVKNGGATPGK